jgi:DHA1 family bicyclomycin/chloramphenicol resistance-like MFS transporter
MLAFAITPGIGVAFGGFINEYYGWMCCFYASALYGLLLLILVTKLPETKKIIDPHAFEIKHLLKSYGEQFSNTQLITGGLLMGSSTCFVYVFATVAPFIAINLFNMNSAQYGLANILPPIGLILGSLLSAQLAQKFELKIIIKMGVSITIIGVAFMTLAVIMSYSLLTSLFLPMIIIYFGLGLIMANASTLAMSHVTDKAHGSAVMNFINMGLATIAVLSVGYISLNKLVLPLVFITLCSIMVVMYRGIIKDQTK